MSIKPVKATLYKRENGVYYVKWREGEKERRRSLGTTKLREAQLLRDGVNEEIRAKKLYPDRAQEWTLRDAFQVYMEHEEGRLSEATVESYSRSWRQFEKAMPVATLAAVLPDHILQWRRAMSDKGFRPVTVNTRLQNVNTVLRWFIQQGMLKGPSPAEKVSRLRETKRPPRFLSEDECSRLLAAARAVDEDLYLFCCLCLYAGLRKGEAIGARWEWINWAGNTITVPHDESFMNKSQKTRTIPIAQSLRPILEQRRQDSGFLCYPHGKGKRYRMTVDRPFSRAVALAQVDCSPHTLRHTFASLLAQKGVSLYKIQGYLGHSSFMTTQIYAHLCPAEDSLEL